MQPRALLRGSRTAGAWLSDVAPSVGDEISVYADIERQGRTSLTIRADAEARERDGERTFPVATGTFTFVALGAGDKPRPVAAQEN